MMDIKELVLLKNIEEIKEWVSKEWEDKEIEGKIFCMEYIEPFIDVEHFIEDRDRLEELEEYCYKNLSLNDVKVIKRMYEETSHFVGFHSLEFNFFIDNIIDEMNVNELIDPSKKGVAKEKSDMVHKTLNALLGKE